jgi:Flp pilus assembly pilin Flp
LNMRVKAVLKWLRGDQRGLETIEIVLIAALVIVGSIVLWRTIGGGVRDNLGKLCDAVTTESNPECHKAQ